MRGKAENACVTDEGNRITPAYAGKSLQQYIDFAFQWDHPRLCGEKWGQLQSNSGNRGSPPPMRGKEIISMFGSRFPWITPAYAGKRHDTLSQCHKRQDHPRLCGEKTSTNIWRYVHRGSPPPMRGKV